MFRVPKGYNKVKNPSQYHSVQQEKAWADKLGGDRTPGSGNKDIKGDVRVKKILRLENKCTINNKKSFSITKKMLDKIYDAALLSGEIPAIEVEMLEDSRVVYSVCVLPSYVLEDLVEYYRIIGESNNV